MANYRTTADILDSVLSRCGEVTNGNSPYEARTLEYLNRIQQSVICGGNEFNIEVDEPWVWARSPNPIVLELQPKYETGTVTVTNGSTSATFSSAPSYSVQGWFLRIKGRDGVFKLATHVASNVNFTLNGAYDGDSGTLNFEIFKLDYELVPSHITIDDTNNKLDFEETASSELTATIVNGSYTPAELATAVDTALTAAGSSSYTISYDSVTRKFTLASDRSGGGGTFKLLAQSGSNQAKSAWEILGFDVEDQSDAASHTSTYILGGIARLIEPIIIHKGYRDRSTQRDQDFIGILDPENFTRNYSLNHAAESYPSRACILKENHEGAIVIRINHYPKEKTKVELNYIPMPRDLKDNAQSVPIIPRKYIDVLEFGAAAELLFEKEDSKWEGFMQKAGAKLQAMMTQNRNMLQRIGKNFAQTIARPDLVTRKNRRLIYGVPEES